MIGAAVVVNEVDAKRWFGQLLPELTRFDVRVAWVLDSCSDETKKIVHEFPLTVGVKEMEGEVFKEKWRGHAVQPLRDAGCKWVILWDSDDTFAPNAPDIFRKTLENETRPVGYVRRVNIVTQDGKDYIRTDGPFKFGCGSTQVNRMILYNLGYDLKWMDDVTHGPYTFKDGLIVDERFQVEAYSVHWGLRDHDLRVQHKERWDFNYTKAIGRNPYGLWNLVLDDTITPTLEPYDDWILSQRT